MTTIHVVIAEKEYSTVGSAKVVAAFDQAELAERFVEAVNSVEPRYKLKVWPIELQKAGLQVIGTANMAPPLPLAQFDVVESKEPPVNWQVAPEIRYEIDAQGRSARIHGGPVKGTITVRDGAPEVFIPSNSAAADKP